MEQSFNPLNGEETIEVILSKIRKALELSGEFRQNITYPVMQVTAEVSLWAHPKQAFEDDKFLDAEPWLKIKVPAYLIDTPDKERHEAGLQIPKVEKIGGVHVDVRQDQPVKPPKGSTASKIEEAMKAALPVALPVANKN